MPAILGWAGKRPAEVQKGRANYFEAAALLAALALFGFPAFVAFGISRLSVQSAPMRGTEILAEVPPSVSANEPRVRLMPDGRMKS